MKERRLFWSNFQNIKDWEIMDDLQGDSGASGETMQDTSPPGICEGYLMKRRKWPLKGWHKVSKAQKNSFRFDVIFPKG